MRVIVVGTGTDVGKTHVTVSLLAEARRRGHRARGYKPVATGVEDRCDDAERHAVAAGEAYESPTFSYRPAVSPHLAARLAERPIVLERLQHEATRLESGRDLFVIEAAGGLFSPLSETLTNADLVSRLLPARVLLVASDRLGVLHDVRASVLAASKVGVAIAGVVLSAPPLPDGSTGTNAAELARVGGPAVAAVFPRANPNEPSSESAAARLLDFVMGD